MDLGDVKPKNKGRAEKAEGEEKVWEDVSEKVLANQLNTRCFRAHHIRITRPAWAPWYLQIKENQQKVIIFLDTLDKSVLFLEVFFILPLPSHHSTLTHSDLWPILAWALLFPAAEFDIRAISLNQEEMNENNSSIKKCNFQLVALSPQISKSPPTDFLKLGNDSATRKFSSIFTR